MLQNHMNNLRTYFRATTADLRILVLDSTDNLRSDLPLSEFVKLLFCKLGLASDEHNPECEQHQASLQASADSSSSLSLDELFKHLIIVFNKMDLADRKQCTPTHLSLHHTPVCHLSCVTEAGVDDFINQLKQKVSSLCADPSTGNPSVTHARHRRHLQLCLEALSNYEDIMDVDIVLAAQELRKALRQIGKITGRITSEEILDVIFGDFCIGK